MRHSQTARLVLITFAVLAASLPAASGAAAAQGEDSPPALDSLQFRTIGPAVVGGRIADIAAVDADTFYVAAATGNLWKTTNRGTTWEALFEQEEVNSIGDVTVAPSNPDVIWVGTGEANNRQSSPWGAGVYRSRDGGRTWDFRGLEQTRHIGRIVVHPDDPNTAWVAAGGNLWAASEARGVFRTRDGGDSWEKVLYIDADTGATDIAIAPGDPETIIAATYQRRRSACCFVGGGPGSGLHRTRDGGDTWERLAEGLPEGDMGRIGLDFFAGDGNLVMAVIEAGGGATGVYRSEDRGTTGAKTSDTNPRPMYFSQIRIDPQDPQRVYVLGQDLYISDDGGRTFTDEGALSVHLDHHALWIDPSDPGHMIIGSDGGVSVSFDRSRTWRMLDNLPLAQFYEIGVDLQEPHYRVFGGLQDNGSWGGPASTRDSRGIRNADWFNINGGDGFYTVVDPNDPTVVFAESQNGNLARLDLRTMERQSIRPLPRNEQAEEAEPESEAAEYRWNWNTPIVLSAHDTATVYTGANVVLRSLDRGYSWEAISPDLTRAIDRDAEELMGVTPGRDTLSRHDGISSYGNITTLSESPLNAQELYVGTDDGTVQRSRDGGASWTDLTETFPELPDRAYVSRLRASATVPGRVYASFDNHYGGDFRPFVYRSENHGDSWTAIVAGLPDWSVNVVTEHPRNPNLLFLGNELGLYVSWDAGDSWRRFTSNLPTVPVDDIVVHPTRNDLVLGTHGRGVWILDDLGALEHLADAIASERPVVLPVRDAYAFNAYSPQQWTGDSEYAAPAGPRGALLRYFVPESWQPEAADAAEPQETEAREAGGDPVMHLEISALDGGLVRELEVPATPGLHHLSWDLRTDPPFEPEPGSQTGRGRFFGPPPGIRVLPGDYQVSVAGDPDTPAQTFAVLLDPELDVSSEDLQARQAAMQKAYEFARPFSEANAALQRLREQAGDAAGQIREAGGNEPLAAQAKELTERLSELGDSLGEYRRASFAAFSIERSTTRPTDDQTRALDRARVALPGLIGELNEVITVQLPALYSAMNAAGIRPDPGEPIDMPSWQR